MESGIPNLVVRLPELGGRCRHGLANHRAVTAIRLCVASIGTRLGERAAGGFELADYPVPKGIFNGGRVIRTIKTRYGVLLTNSLSSALSMRLAGVRAIGYRSDGRAMLLQGALNKGTGLHEVEYFWRLGKAAVDRWGPPESSWPKVPPEHIELPLSNAHRAAAAMVLVKARISGPYTVCCPMAVGTAQGQSKMWPLFGKFCETLAAMGKTILICPGPGEEPMCANFQPFAKVLPNISLGAYAALLAGAEMVVANDSGPMHIAAAVGAPVLGIFGRSNPLRTYPWGGQFVGSADGWPDLETVLSACIKIQTRGNLRIAG